MRAFFYLFVCSFLPTAHAYEYCNYNNNYLERMLPEPAETVSVSLPQACVEASHRSLPTSGYYGYCATEEGTPARTHPRPCISHKYVSSVHSTLVDVADCLDFDPRLAFATFNLESALHMNAVGAAADVGIGQLTQTAIDEVTMNALDKAKRAAMNSEKASCARILPFMTARDSTKANRCGYMALPANPTRNLIYSILLIQQNRKSLERYWTRLGIVLPSNVNEERLKERLTMLAYNAGSAGSVATLKAYIDQMGPQRLNERLLNFESRDFYSFVNYMARFYPIPRGKESSRKRVSKYVKYIIQAGRRVEAIAGISCFEAGTFPPLNPNTPVVFAGAQPDFRDAEKLIARNLQLLAQDDLSLPVECQARRASLHENFRDLAGAFVDPCGG
jgi:hypothetical protein